MNQARQSFEKPRLMSLPIRMQLLTESKALAGSMKTAAQYCFFIDGGYDIVSDLERG